MFSFQTMQDKQSKSKPIRLIFGSGAPGTPQAHRASLILEDETVRIVLLVEDVLHELEAHPTEVRHAKVIFVRILEPLGIVVRLPRHFQQPGATRRGRRRRSQRKQTPGSKTI